MQKKSFVWMLLFVVCLTACNWRSSSKTSDQAIARNGSVAGYVTDLPTSAPAATIAESRAEQVSKTALPKQQGQGSQNAVQLAKADLSQTVTQAFDRKIIRNGNLEIELEQPEAAQRKAATIAETNGGFVVTSEARKTDGSVTVNVVMRVPSAQFNTVIELLRTQLGEQAGGRILQDKTSGMDVTEEFYDLEARIKTKKALEDQFLVIMRSANKVADALEVQRQIAEVRGEIEQMEGRRRLLENQAALSTITLNLHTPAPIVMATTKGFWVQVKQAFANGVDSALAIVLGVIEFVLVSLPILVLIVLPVGALLWWLRKKISWGKVKEATSDVSGD